MHNWNTPLRLPASNLLATTLVALVLLAGCQSESTDAEAGSKSNTSQTAHQDLREKMPLVEEPAYNGTARYGLLASDVMASKLYWMVIDDDKLYIDGNGDGRLSESESQAFATDKMISLESQLGTELQLQTTAPAYEFGDFINSLYPERLENDWRLYSLQPKLGNSIGLWLAPKKEDVVVTYMKGPLAFTLARPSDCELSRTEPLKFDVKVAIAETIAAKQAVGQPQTRTIFAPLMTRDCEEGLSPIATFYFPNEDQSQSPIVKEVRLKQRC